MSILSAVIIIGLIFFFIPHLDDSLFKGSIFSTGNRTGNESSIQKPTNNTIQVTQTNVRLNNTRNENSIPQPTNNTVHVTQTSLRLNNPPNVVVQNPITVSLELIDDCDNFIQTKNMTELELLKNNANWLIVNANRNGNYSFFENSFSSEKGLNPVHSALAQGFALQGLAKAYSITGNTTYLTTTTLLLNSFDVNVRDGGITEMPAANGMWYEAFVTSGNANSHELTGMMYTLLALHDYYKLTHNPKAEYLFNQGIGALAANVANYDNGFGSYDDALSSTPADLTERETQAYLLTELYAITGEHIFQEYANKWKSYGEPLSNEIFSIRKISTNLESNNVRIAIVKNTFTGGAYNNAFYNFYGKYYFWNSGKNITSNVTHPGFGLDLLTGTIPDYDIGGYNTWYIPFMKRHLESVLPGSKVGVLTDQDVHHGLIFDKNGSNAYNLIILGHQEYVTEQEYENLRTFVNNGGKIIFLDGNVFYAQVSYNENKNSVTLIKGHGWEFDGNVARKSTLERWFNETSDWMGGNYWPRGNEQIDFTNNVFGYTNDEETFVNNPKDKIIIDYGAERKDILNNKAIVSDELAYGNDFKVFLEPKKIATYELDYGKGSVINLGLYAENLYGKPKFNSFFDTLVMGILSDNPSAFNYAVSN